MENNSILKAIFDGEYAPFSDVIPNSPEYHQARAKRDSEWEFFEKMIPEEHKARFEELMAAFFEVSGFEAYEFYKEGFKSGFELTKELMSQ